MIDHPGRWYRAVWLIVGLMAMRAEGQICDPLWHDLFPSLSVEPGGGEVRAFALLPGKDGSELVMAGLFKGPNEDAWGILIFRDGVWRLMGSGFGPWVGTTKGVYALGMHEGELFAAGEFALADGTPANNIARWDGKAWHPLGQGVNKRVRALCSFDDGTGPALFVGGLFTEAGGKPAKHLAKWDGAAWSEVGGGVSLGDGSAEGVYALHTFDFGDGDRLCIGGSFEQAGNIPASNVATWNGSTWSAIGDGLSFSPTSPPENWVYTFETWHDAGQVKLLAGGRFSHSGAVLLKNIAYWDGAAWQSMGSGLTGSYNGPNSAFVSDLHVFDDGNGPRLYAGGYFALKELPSGDLEGNFGRWNGSDWELVVDGWHAGGVTRALLSHDASGHGLWVGGSGLSPGNFFGTYVRWDGVTWAQPTKIGPYYGELCAVAVNGQPSLFLTPGIGLGGFDKIFPLARWDGDQWHKVPDFLPGQWSPIAMTPGPQSTLWVAASVSGQPLDRRLIEWDGQAWTDHGAWTNFDIGRLLWADVGQGPELFTQGTLNSGALGRIAKWAGDGWAHLGTLYGRDIALFDDGAGGLAIHTLAKADFGAGNDIHLVRWDGLQWQPVGPAFDTAGLPNTLLAFEGRLYVGGSAMIVSGLPPSDILAWDGAAWSEVGGGLWSPPQTFHGVHHLVVADDGRGPALFVHGQFSKAGGENGIKVTNLARWDGQAWSSLGGLPGEVFGDWVQWDDGDGPALWLSAAGITPGGIRPTSLTKWACPKRDCPADCDGNRVLDILDFLCYQEKFVSGDPAADFEGDGDLDIFDFLAFQSAFVNGCG